MNISQFRISLSEVKTLYDELGFIKFNGPKELYKDGVTSEFKELAHRKDYLEAYKVGIKNFDYDFLLSDNSFFQFSIRIVENSLSDLNYSFYHNPFYFISFDEYLDIQVQSNLITEDDITLFEDYLLDEYDQFLNEQKLSSISTLIRYDYDIPNHRALIHPASHFHIGNNSSVRIPCSKLVTPYQFALFVLRHVYYDVWVRLLNPIETVGTIYKKSACSDLDGRFWDDLERNDLFLV